MDVGDLPANDAADEHLVGVPHGAGECEDLVATAHQLPRMGAPATA